MQHTDLQGYTANQQASQTLRKCQNPARQSAHKTHIFKRNKCAVEGLSWCESLPSQRTM